MIFHLDPVRVFHWLKLQRADWPNHAVASLISMTTRRKFGHGFSTKCGPLIPFQQIPESELVNCAVYNLVHSFSHLVLRQAVIQSGFDRTSLSEYLFPSEHSLLLFIVIIAQHSLLVDCTPLFEQTLHEHLRCSNRPQRKLCL